MSRATLLMALFLAGCARHVPQWLVPPTEEGNACKRQCIQVRATCGTTRRTKKGECRQQEQECLSTCPGAMLVDD